MVKPKSISDSSPTLLVSFGTFCAPCKAEVPHIANISKKYPNFNVVAASNESKDKIQQFIADYPACKAYFVACDEGGYV